MRGSSIVYPEVAKLKPAVDHVQREGKQYGECHKHSETVEDVCLFHRMGLLLRGGFQFVNIPETCTLHPVVEVEITNP